MDVDKYYQKGVPDMMLASCGVSTAEGYDKIYLFVEKGKYTDEVVSGAVSILEKMSQEASLYSVKKILTIDKLPMTSVGKVKRFLLKKHVEEMGTSASEVKDNKKVFYKKIKKTFVQIIVKYAQDKSVTLNLN